MTSSELLIQIEKAIAAVAVGGQSYKIGSRALTRANLTELVKLRERLTSEAAADSAASANLMDDTYVAAFMGR